MYGCGQAKSCTGEKCNGHGTCQLDGAGMPTCRCTTGTTGASCELGFPIVTQDATCALSTPAVADGTPCLMSGGGGTGRCQRQPTGSFACVAPATSTATDLSCDFDQGNTCNWTQATYDNS